MKLLIAYDGSECSDRALLDRRVAGMPDVVEAVVVSAAERWLPPPAASTLAFPAEGTIVGVEPAGEVVSWAYRRLESMFPRWDIRTALYRRELGLDLHGFRPVTGGKPSTGHRTRVDRYAPARCRIRASDHGPFGRAAGRRGQSTTTPHAEGEGVGGRLHLRRESQLRATQAILPRKRRERSRCACRVLGRDRASSRS
jgi:hypothetical protein